MDFQLNLATENVAQAVPEEPLIVAPTTSVHDVLQLMQGRQRGSVMICDAAGALEGIFTERDAVRLLADQAALQLPVSRFMVRNPATLTRTDTVGTAIARMANGGYRRMPVVDEAGHPVGVLGVSRVLEYLVDHFPKVVYTLPPRPHQASQEREGA